MIKYDKLKTTIYTALAILVLSVGYILATKDIVVNQEPEIQVKEIKSQRIAWEPNHELGMVKDDLETYGYLSDRVIEKMVSAIDTASLTYNLPVGMIHAIIRVESEYRFNVVHPTVTVKVKGTPTRTNAAGLGGIVWVLWKDELKEAGIAETELDLFLPENNIQAVGYILRWLIDDELRRRPDVSSSSVMANIVKRYYGAHNPDYLAKMQKITSDLWMKRMARMILAESRQEPASDSVSTRIENLASRN